MNTRSGDVTPRPSSAVERDAQSAVKDPRALLSEPGQEHCSHKPLGNYQFPLTTSLDDLSPSQSRR